MKYKVGDKVRIVNSSIFDESRYAVGDTAVIIGIKHDDYILSMKDEGKQCVNTTYANEFIEEVVMKFKVNDRVIINGGIFTISDIDTEDSTYLVGDTWYDEEQLKAAPSKLADLLGVKDDEPFNVIDEDDDEVDDYMPWKVHGGILVDCDGDAIELSSELISGEYKVVPVKGEWSYGDRMFYVDYDGSIEHTSFDRGCHGDVALVMSGNAFHTKAEAEENQQRISAAIVEKLGEC